MLARVHGLVLAGDIAPTDQIHHVGSEHLGVQTQIVLLSQLDREGVGQAADTQLDGVAVVDHVLSLIHISLSLVFGNKMALRYTMPMKPDFIFLWPFPGLF